MTGPLVTIGIPTYNRSQSLQVALRSALQQDHPNVEVVVSDNASTDATEAVCRDTAAANLRYLRHARNQGPVFNFLQALHAARGEYFMWLADDDWLDAAYVSRCLRHLREHPDCSLAAGRAHYYRDGQFLFMAPPISVKGASGAARVRSYFTQVQDNFSMHGLARRADWLRLRWWDVIGGDWLMVSGMAFQGEVATLEDAPIHRDFTWSPVRTQEMATQAGLPASQGKRPYLTIARSAAWDIVWRNPIYRSMSLPSRVWLAEQVVNVVCRRYQVLAMEGAQLLKQVLPPGAVEALRRLRPTR
jgi:hypothetical protein